MDPKLPSQLVQVYFHDDTESDSEPRIKLISARGVLVTPEIIIALLQRKPAIK